MKYTNQLLVIFIIISVIVLSWIFLSFDDIPSPDTNLITPVKAKIISKPTSTTLIAVGDIMLGRAVEMKILKNNDWLYPFRETKHITSLGDIVFGNLEVPLIEGETTPNGSMIFRTDPNITEGLLFGGFNVLSLANNHIKNQGSAGIINTIEQLKSSGISYTGAGIDITGALAPAIIKHNNITFGFIAFLDNSFVPISYGASIDNSGSPFMDIDILEENILALKKQVNVIIISMHAGTEYVNQPNQKQIEFAHAAIDAGADLVIGHHPHVVQPIEYYNDGLIIYSLGNFIFDQMWSESTREGAIAKITFENSKLENLELIPAKIFDYSQPRILDPIEGKAILERMSDFTF